MKNLSQSLGAKITAIFLVLLLGFFGLLSAIGAGFLYDAGGYSGVDSYYRTNWCDNQTYNYAYDVYYWYVNSDTEWNSSWDEMFSADATNFAFEITAAAEPDTVLAANYQPENIGYSTSVPIGDLIINCSVADPVVADDNYSLGYQAFNFLYDIRYELIIFAVVGLVLALVGFIFLLCAAGHRRDTDGITPNAQDKVPLDVYLLMAGLVVVFLLNLSFGSMNFYGGYGNLIEMVLSCLGLLAAEIVTLATLMTLATRFKIGKWWRNTIIYICLKLAGRVFRRMVAALRLLPLVWRSAAVVAGAILVDLILGMAYYSNPDAIIFLLGFGFNVFLVYAAVKLALTLRKLKQAGELLATGDFETKVDTAKMYYDFKSHGENLNSIGDGMAIAVEQKMKSERLKTELITNVSHDLKTPLTSIVNYVDLLQKEEIANETAREYIAVLARQSAKLRKLTEDLLEVSKASTGNVTVNCKPTNVTELVNQSLGEYTERFAAAGLTPVFVPPEEDYYINADGRLMWRVFDNLLNNICKYSQPQTRVYCDIAGSAGQVCIALKNISRDVLNVSAEDLKDRFVRGDSSRNSEGSGLGLAIADSLTALQKGKFSLYVDGDLFKVFIIFDRLPEPKPQQDQATAASE